MTNRAYIVMYWDAYGEPHQSEKMDKQTAEVFAVSMMPHQDARIVMVTA